MKLIKLNIVFENGSFRVIDQKKLKDFCLKNEGKEGKILIARGELPRNLEQNNYYWGVIIPAFEREGWSDQDDDGNDLGPHESLKRRFLTYKVRTPVSLPYCPKCNLYFDNPELRGCDKCYTYLSTKIINVDLPKLGSTKDLTVRGFWEYCERCIKLLLSDDVKGYLTTLEGKEWIDLSKKNK